MTRCKDCKYWEMVEYIGGHPAASKLTMGKCLYNPPAVVVDTTGIRTAWPITPENNFCRFFELQSSARTSSDFSCSFGGSSTP